MKRHPRKRQKSLRRTVKYNGVGLGGRLPIPGWRGPRRSSCTAVASGALSYLLKFGPIATHRPPLSHHLAVIDDRDVDGGRRSRECHYPTTTPSAWSKLRAPHTPQYSLGYMQLRYVLGDAGRRHGRTRCSNAWHSLRRHRTRYGASHAVGVQVSTHRVDPHSATIAAIPARTTSRR